MRPLTEADIRGSFINATKREIKDAHLPDLGALNWDRLDLLGWRDRKAPLSAYVVLELEGNPTGIILRSAERTTKVRRRAMCAWCEDLIETDDVTMYVARRGGAAGRKGDTIGTMLCTDFGCSAHARRRPTSIEAGSDSESFREAFIARRVDGLRQRSSRFVAEILKTTAQGSAAS